MLYKKGNHNHFLEFRAVKTSHFFPLQIPTYTGLRQLYTEIFVTFYIKQKKSI